MTTFVDTSAFLTILDADDPHYATAAEAWIQQVSDGAVLLTTNYVVLETISVLHRRHGLPPIKRFLEDILSVVFVDWVDQDTHLAGARSLLAGSRNGPSLVDCISFETIDRHGITNVFAYDKHFDQRGFQLIGRRPSQ